MITCIFKRTIASQGGPRPPAHFVGPPQACHNENQISIMLELFQIATRHGFTQVAQNQVKVALKLLTPSPEGG